MSDEVLVRAEGVGKKFCRDLKTALKYGVRDIAGELIGRPRTQELRPQEFWAVQDVNFELCRGESLALIGHNGAGKTTLLKMLNGLIKPDRGRIEMRGTVGAMIALGAGFNPVLTGRENVYTNAAVLGLSKREVDARFDEVVAFSEIGKFIDSPVKNYSSGMSVRLGFSVAALLLKPDILILDEVLAVGDLPFRIKCINHMRSIMSECAVIFVSHSMPTVSSFCNRALLMSGGRVISEAEEDMGSVIQQYVALAPNRKPELSVGEVRKDQEGFRIRLVGKPVQEEVSIAHGASLAVELEFEVDQPCNLFLSVIAEGTLPVLQYRLVDRAGERRAFAPGIHRVRCDLGTIDLGAARYNVDAVMVTDGEKQVKRFYQVLVLDVTHPTRSWHHVLRTTEAVDVVPVDA